MFQSRKLMIQTAWSQRKLSIDGHRLPKILPYVINEGLKGGGWRGGGVWNSLISKNLTHYSLSLQFLLIL